MEFETSHSTEASLLVLAIVGVDEVVVSLNSTVPLPLPSLGSTVGSVVRSKGLDTIDGLGVTASPTVEVPTEVGAKLTFVTASDVVEDAKVEDDEVEVASSTVRSKEKLPRSACQPKSLLDPIA